MSPSQGRVPATPRFMVPGQDHETPFLPRWRVRARSRSWGAVEELAARAGQFITMFHTENRLGPPDRRLRRVRREIEATGTYWHTPAELVFGARVAWRNSSRCIGRLYWQSLRVRDRREIVAAPDVAAEAVTHLREATNGGRIRPSITVFGPDAPGRPGPRILNSQIVRYAGYPASGRAAGAPGAVGPGAAGPGAAGPGAAGPGAVGAVVGDPASADLTRLALDLGWPGRSPAGRFDVLPLLVQEAGAPVRMYDVPADAVLEVPLEHPQFRWFAGLQLRWYAVPLISDMYLDIGGVRYPAAPFNGWYMCTEIGSRDLGDAARYGQLPVIASHMGLPTRDDRNLWKDKAMTELNLAVLHSFTAAGVTITDHHTESVRFLAHLQREEQHGRSCPADWTWIVPPAASSATPVFHRYYQDFDQTPNFYRHPPPAWEPAAEPAQAGQGTWVSEPEPANQPGQGGQAGWVSEPGPAVAAGRARERGLAGLEGELAAPCGHRDPEHVR